jgi:hypothetical protein
MAETLCAEQFIERLRAHCSTEQAMNTRRYFKTGEGEYSANDVFIGVRMGNAQHAALCPSG